MTKVAIENAEGKGGASITVRRAEPGMERAEETVLEPGNGKVFDTGENVSLKIVDTVAAEKAPLDDKGHQEPPEPPETEPGAEGAEAGGEETPPGEEAAAEEQRSE